MSNHIVNFENFEFQLRNIINMNEWQKLQDCFNYKKNIIFISNGGNNGLAIHLAADISRLTDKHAFTLGSSITTTSIIGDVGFENMWRTWLEMVSRSLNPKETMVIGNSCSIGSESSRSIENALLYSSELNYETFLITAKRKLDITSKVTQVVTELIYYHSHELISGALYYQLIHSYTNGQCPPMIKNRETPDPINCRICNNGELDHSYCEPQYEFRDVPPNCEQDKNNIAIDFDGVIHNFNKGFFDGTCYGNPLPGSLEAIKQLSEKYNIIIFSSKCLPDRPLVNGLTGKQLIVDWLKKYNILKYIRDVTHLKPRAKYYIDDKAIHFDNNWEEILNKIT